MEKVLKKYTSIPQSLYINRSADEQLMRIINEMQRPGYVLVARQMGKTNLLFNAKRTLENANRLFVYVDLSNVFLQERECYRNIIDTILEPNENLFEDIEKDVEVLRNKNTPPHKEYTNSLRIVLAKFQGDIVIILDEIDALRSSSYSDNIFAQIRSNYFSRTNFPVFERLTYVLSGVIEPTELIKDRNKSPFNIGDKIYLEDFSIDEHKSFILKSELQISEDISHQIYYWTNGNPRMTFDICSSVENLLMEGKIISIASVDSLIKSKYLTTYDIAPIDHIRELVKTEKKVRNAVLSIQQNKAAELNDEIKKKLYLYGIINSNFDDDTVIKNPIIKASLSEDWIKAIDKQTQSSYNYGLEKIDQFEYRDAIISLKEFISNSNPGKKQLEICQYNIGFAYYNLGKIDDAIEYFSEDYSIPLYKSNSKSFHGICKIRNNQIDEGAAILEEVINESTGFAYRNAILNLAPVVKIRDKDRDRALKLYDDLYDSTFSDKDDTSLEELDKLRTLAHYYKAEIFFEDKNLEDTLNSIEDAMQYASPTDLLHLKFSKYNLANERDENLKFEIVDSIIENKFKFETRQLFPISFSPEHLLNYLGSCFNPDNQEKFEQLLN
ncbi:MAG: AAA-like domain-containing protein, partial [Chitinophagales bacterium]|nr:AAA-like domain-containing protein [Chitinophagales bacterium]